MKASYLIFACMFAVTVVACSNPEKENKIFAHYDPSSKTYKQELARQLTTKQHKDLTFTFDRCYTIDNKEYLGVKIQGYQLTANGLIRVNNWSKLENLKNTNGKGYRGAELKGLKLNVEDTASGPELVYQDVDKIVD